MFGNKKSFEILNQRKYVYIITDMAVLLIAVGVFLLMFFSVFDKAFTEEAVSRGVYMGVAAAFFILLLRRHPLGAVLLNIAILFVMIYINYDIIRESVIQIFGFARTRGAFSLDTDVYSAFLGVSFFIFICLMAYLQNLRLSFIPFFVFLGATTAYMVILNKPYDMNIYIFAIITGLCLVAYSFSSRNSRFLGFVSFAVFGVLALLVSARLRTGFGEKEYKDFRENNELLSSFDKQAVVDKLTPDIMISSLTQGNLFSFTVSGAVRSQLMLILTASDYTNDFIMKSYTGDTYTGTGWDTLSDDDKKHIPVRNPENIAMKIADRDLTTQKLLFDYNAVNYSIEKVEGVNTVFKPYFKTEPGEDGFSGFNEISSKQLTNYDITPQQIRQALTTEAPGGETEELLEDEERYRDYVYENYLYVPEGLKADLSSLTAGLEDTGFKSQLIADLRERINENIEFTIAPPAPSSGSDPIKFAIDSHAGGSNQLASVGVMALRYLGIPARYAEGIAVAQTAKEKSPFINDKYKIDVTNLDAIAYGEAYIDGLGWLPVNFLPDNALEIANSDIENLRTMDNTEFKNKLKENCISIGRTAARAIAKAVVILFCLAVIVIIIRRYLILLVRKIKISHSSLEKSKKALYDYTEAVKAFFDKNIFEDMENYASMNELLYSSRPSSTVKEVYGRAVSVTKEDFKKAPFIKKLSALFVKVIL